MHVGGVHARPETLIGLVVVGRVTGVVIHPAVVVAKHRLADEDELLVTLLGELVGDAPQVPEVARVKAVGDVQAQAVDVELALPAANDAGQVIVDYSDRKSVV